MAARIEAPQRGSARSVYETKWTIFRKWCLSNQVNFRAPTLKGITDFLPSFKTGSYNRAPLMATDQSLLTNWKIQPIRSAKMRISLVSMIASTETDQGSQRHPISLVLYQLTKSPFESFKAASLKHLTSILSSSCLWVQANTKVRSMLG